MFSAWRRKAPPLHVMSLVGGLSVVPYAGWNSTMLMGGAPCWAEPSITSGWRDLQVRPVRRPPRVKCPTKWPATCATVETVTGKNNHGTRGSSTGTGAPGKENGWDRGGRQSCHPPLGCTSRPRVYAGCCPDPEPFIGNVRGWRQAAPRPQGIPKQTKSPLPTPLLSGDPHTDAPY